jgi:aspartyl aminopeptidase
VVRQLLRLLARACVLKAPSCHAHPAPRTPQGEEGAVERTLRQSFLVSADMAHALHPNYTDKHDSLLAPAFQGGLVLKHNNNQRYATNAISAALFRCAFLVTVCVWVGWGCVWGG